MMWWVLGLMACGTSPNPEPHDLKVEERLGLLEALAGNDGWTAQRGSYSFLDHTNCCVPGANCLWNNPSTPYGFLGVPPAPGQTAVDAMVMPDGTARAFHFRQDEVIVLLGQTPPEARYYSWRSYLMLRPDFPEPEPILGSLGASTNNAVVADQLGDAFDRPFALVTSGDLGQELRVRSLLRQAGFAESEIFTDRITEGYVNYGLGDESDVLMQVGRTSMIADPDAQAAFYADPPFEVLRLTPEVALSAFEPHSEPDLPVRGTGSTEEAWRDAQEQLGEALRTALVELGTEPLEAEATAFWFETLGCMEDPGYCSGDIRDRHYERVPSFYMPTDDSFAVAYGVNHERTGKATYSNVAVDTVTNMIGLEAVNSVQMVGSAAAFLPGHPQVDDLFVQVFARRCDTFDGWPCVEVPYTCPGVPVDEQMLISFRAYLEPQTGAAPLETELVPSKVLLYVPEEASPSTGSGTTSGAPSDTGVQGP